MSSSLRSSVMPGSPMTAGSVMPSARRARSQRSIAFGSKHSWVVTHVRCQRGRRRRAELVPSRQVAPPSIAECVSNLEIRVEASHAIANTTVYTGRVVGCLVQQEAIDRDRAIPEEPGLGFADLLYEVSITGNPSRMNFTRMAIDRIYPTDPTLGDAHRWIGSFTTRMESEEQRGRITAEERDRLLALNKAWLANRDPNSNGDVKSELTALLRDVCGRTVGG
jgi:hypothetical protein